jgi:hypothetical protein
VHLYLRRQLDGLCRATSVHHSERAVHTVARFAGLLLIAPDRVDVPDGGLRSLCPAGDGLILPGAAPVCRRHQPDRDQGVARSGCTFRSRYAGLRQSLIPTANVQERLSKTAPAFQTVYGVGVDVGVAVSVAVGVRVIVGVNVGVGVSVGQFVGVGDGVPPLVIVMLKLLAVAS